MLEIIVTTNPYEVSEYAYYEAESITAFMEERRDLWTSRTRLYAGNVSDSCDITPKDERDIELLAEVQGTVYIVVYPESGVFNFIGDVISFAFLGVLSFLLPSNKTPDLGSVPSANNSLGERSNKARPNSRIPDIFGQVRSIPDLLTVPYRIYENNVEVEISYMCVGRGSYEIDDVRDGDTLLGSIAGAGATFYEPDTSPNSGTPQLTIGSAITQDLYDAVKLNEVNGQTLIPPNNQSYSRNLRFISPNVIEGHSGEVDFTVFAPGITLNVSGGSFDNIKAPVTLYASVRFEDGGIISFEDIDPNAYFSAGDDLFLSNASYSALDDGGIDYLFIDLIGNYIVDSVDSTSVTLVSPELINSDWDKLVDYSSDRTEYKISTVGSAGGSETVNLDGAFTILSVSTTQIILSNPEATNTDYLKIADFAGGTTPFERINVSSNGIAWVGWFDIPLQAVAGNKIIFNIVAPQGVYGINDKGEQNARTESVTVEIRPIDKDGTVLGATEYAYGTLTGSDTEKSQVAITIESTPSFNTRAQARIRRTSPTDLNPKHQAIDELKWDSCYGLGPVTASHFGNVTTVFSRTYATTSATSLKERRLNALVTRKVPLWDGDEFGALTAQTSAAPIICAMALDPEIGNRSLSELNVPQIYAEIEALQTYFGFIEATNFCYTFDNDNISFEETVSTVAGAVFSTAYRLGNIIHLYGEMSREDEPALLLLNHRNKLPKSENRTFTFGVINDYDGVELTYVNADDDTTNTIYIPDDQSARNPKKIETVGIRNEDQATLQANRAYNKLIFQNTTTQFDALEETEYLIPNNRILIADNTRTGTKDGYIKTQLGLVLELSQPFVGMDGVEYTIFLQHIDGTVEALDCEPGDDEWHVVLANAPALPLSLGLEQSVVAHYWIVGDNEPRASTFLLSEKEPSGKNAFTITAVNYDSRYYQNDQDFA